ncbi:MAG TPA: erythromycin esterase family protein [Isosphaeraceae bacterium]|nr:erythromycin esterase family protein [Isosphaeraceae bacterium]
MPASFSDQDLARAVRSGIEPLTGGSRDYDSLLNRVGDARFVLLGEASHGTHEFYVERARITRRLIEEKGFTAVAVEADWPDAYRINRYVRGSGEDADGVSALANFHRFPMWMWRNADVLDFVEWLFEHNARLSRSQEKTGFYGLDLYSLHASIQAVVGYLDRVDPNAAQQARERYSCFDHVGKDSQAYGLAASLDVSESCEQEVVAQLVELQRRAAEYARRDGRIAEDEFFYAEQNARLARNAEAYYRSMYQGRVSSWNLRDRHMVETLSALTEHLEKTTGRRTKVVVWAHNSHLGDARATEMGDQGEWNVGQLVRQQFGTEAVNVGFTTYDGTVTAAARWDAPAERKRVRPALRGSFEAVFHEVDTPRFLIPLNDEGDLAEGLRSPRLERAIGVIYRPETERRSHYFEARLSDQFDHVIHIDRTEAAEPLDRDSGWDLGEVPDTYPMGV